jgi:glycosyltransferase involved in cell wall biosynthesis
MSILYMLTAPPPRIPGTDAVFQEVALLQRAFAGEVVNLFPLGTPNSRLPKWLYGLHKLGEIRRLEARCRLNHIYFPFLHAFPVLRLLRNPTVYTVVAGLERYRKPTNLAPLQALHRIVVSTARVADVLHAWGLTNTAVVPPGIDTTGIVPVPLALADELTLLMASAPWEREQFDLKGVDALLEVAARLPYLRLILLWRGLFADELEARVRRLGIAGRVEVVDRKVDVGAHLARAHAAVLLAKQGDIVKAYPHSLLESLVAGKPVLVSECIPMADYVRQRQCGIVLDEVGAPALLRAIENLKANYPQLSARAAEIGPDAFSLNVLVDNHRRIYGL